MAIQFLSGFDSNGNSTVTGTLSVSSISNDNSSYTGVLVWDGNVLKYRTKTQIRSDIGAGTGSMSSFSVSNGTSTGSITNGGTLTLTGGTGITIGLTGSAGSGVFSISGDVANSSQVGVGNVNINGGGAYDGLRLSYSSGTATLGLDPQSLPGYSGTASGADTASISMIIHNNDDVNNINQELELEQLQSMIDTNYYVNSVSFNTGNGVLTLGRSGLSSLTVDLDGRYVTSSGVTSVATGSGLTGGTITSTGTLSVDSTVVRTTGTQSIAGEKTFSSTAFFTNAGGIRANKVGTQGGQQLVLNAGESASYATGQTNEFVYVNAESGMQINSSPDNWSSGWAGRKTTTINNTSGDSSFSRNVSMGGSLTVSGDAEIGIQSFSSQGNFDIGDTAGFNSGTSMHCDGSAITVEGGAGQTYFSVGVSGTTFGDSNVSGIITLNGTGRIQGIDTVSSGTDAANKNYVDNAVAGAGGIGGSGTANYIPRFSGSTTLANSLLYQIGSSSSQGLASASTNYYWYTSGTPSASTGTGFAVRSTASTYNSAEIRIQSANTGTSTSDGLTLGMGGQFNNYAYMQNRENKQTYFYTNNSIRMTIKGSNGYVGILDSTPSYQLDVNGTIRATGNVIAYSDVRSKENIKTIDSPLDKVLKLRGVEFNKIGKKKKEVGVIAQEIEKVLPEVVSTDDEGMKSVAYGNIVGVLIEGMKEQQKQIEALTDIVEELTKRIK